MEKQNQTNIKKKVLFLVPYPLQKAPSQRFRVEAFLSVLSKAGIEYRIYPFFRLKVWSVLYKKGSFFLKTAELIRGLTKRWGIVIFKVPYYDYVFIHRESAPIGPPIFEWVIVKIYRKKIIYDFDDAIWIPNTSSANHFSNWLKAFWKVKYICAWSYKIVVGNDYLYKYANQFNKNVVKIPTCINTGNDQLSAKPCEAGRLNVGWTGSHSTLKYLDEIAPVVNQLQKEFDFNFLIIADKPPSLPFNNFQFIQWNESTEKEDISRLDIGIMPLLADPWSEGKCGFKIIQYFASGIPAVASPVGVNKTIIDEGVNGFLCSTHDEWKSSLRILLTDKFLRERMGKAGRKKIEEFFSTRSHSFKFIELFA